MNKQEEIKLLEDFFNKIPKNSYLDLILNGIKEETIEQIKNDFAINISEEKVKFQNQKYELEKEVQNQKLEIEKVKNNNEKNYKSYIEETQDHKETQKRIEEKNNQINKFEKVQEELNIMIDDLELENIKLKAKLYDLMNK